ncbi:MAG: ribosome maturation factor RimP [Ekhidna sp.]
MLNVLEEKEIQNIVENALNDHPDLFLVDIKIKGNSGNQKVLVFIDGDEGISIDQCGKISRMIGAEMEEQDLMEGKYHLEVSSPGLDFPLTLKRQYQKNIGRGLEVLTVKEEVVEGTLKNVNKDSILLEVKGQERKIEFEEIKQSKVKVSFK